MDNLQSQKPDHPIYEVSFDPPEGQTGPTGGKTTTGSASSEEVAFDPPEGQTGTTGGKTTTGSASGREKS